MSKVYSDIAIWLHPSTDPTTWTPTTYPDRPGPRPGRLVREDRRLRRRHPQRPACDHRDHQRSRNGPLRKTPVMRIENGDTYIAVASNGGAATDAACFHNLPAHPEVTVQDGASTHRRRAREVHGAEKNRWWTVADAAWPHFARFRADAGTRYPRHRARAGPLTVG
ncbi:nitroreductase/quinone reductase family protein [Nocardia aobensis]|uniref:Nitroreductase/quinone reductase family protein n=1 Tax=Nocardia aobensis TaxID=257277 RepID=A0ABW6PE57_9NOCA